MSETDLDDEEPDKFEALYAEANADPVGRCFTCGLAGKQSFIYTGELFEINQEERMFADFATDLTSSFAMLGCRAGHPIGSEVTKLSSLIFDPRTLETTQPIESLKDSTQRALFSNRQCKDWFKHQEGLNPLWHWEQKQLQDIWSTQQRTADALLDFQQKNNEDTSRINKRFFMLGVASVLLALATLFFPNGITDLTQHRLWPF